MLTHQPSCVQDICHVQQQYNSLHNIHSNTPYRLSTACALHSFCVQDRPYLPCSVVIALEQPTAQLTLHAHQHALPTHEDYPSQCLPPPPMHANQQRQNGTRCRDGVKVLWCRSHLACLVFEGSIPTCACFRSENFCVTFVYAPAIHSCFLFCLTAVIYHY